MKRWTFSLFSVCYLFSSSLWSIFVLWPPQNKELCSLEKERCLAPAFGSHTSRYTTLSQGTDESTFDENILKQVCRSVDMYVSGSISILVV